MRREPGAACVTLFCFLSLFLTGCGARSLNKKTARDVIADLDGDAFQKESVYIDSVKQTGQRDAVAEATLHAAFRFEKVDGKWVIREVRLGKRPWEKLDDILRALEQVKTEQTRKLLEEVAAAIEKYREANGALPDFHDYVSLSDALSPKYMNPLIREDAWNNPLAASRSAPAAVRLLSAGPDGKIGTPDDIELVKTFGATR
jgi:hypothetical protein